MHARAILALAAMALTLSACASGPKYSTVATTFPGLTGSSGRIFFYRPSVMRVLSQPDVWLNGQKVGTAKPHGFYFVDRAPGTYEVTAPTGRWSTQPGEKLTFVLEPGQECYVRLNILVGGVYVGWVIPELVARNEALGELKDLSYIPPGAN